MANSEVYSAQTIENFEGDFNSNVELVSPGGRSATAIAAGVATDTVIKAAPGRLCKVLVTTAGTNALAIYDNASGGSGTIIGYVAASAAAGTLADFQIPAANGITVKGNAANPAVTISWD